MPEKRNPNSEFSQNHTNPSKSRQNLWNFRQIGKIAVKFSQVGAKCLEFGQISGKFESNLRQFGENLSKFGSVFSCVGEK